jgi:hypothetical protein
MSASIADTIEGTTLTLDENGQKSVQRTFLVTGLSGTASAKMNEALSVSGIPAWHADHPVISGLAVASMTVTALDSQNANVVCTYKTKTSRIMPPSTSTPGQVTVGGSVQSTDANLDINGALMVVGPPPGVTADSQVGTASIMIPQLALRFSRLEPSSPASNAKTYLGTTNSGTFQGDAAGIWLCTRLEGVSDDGGATYRVDYEFQRCPGGWDATILWVDPETGTPPSGCVDGDGIETYQVYAQTNFGSLNLV